jgi:phage baseplate assembly protein W
MTLATDRTRAFLGIGWKFPLQVTAGGNIALSSYEQRVQESIYLILSTAKGERVMLPDFGCGIHDLVFAPNNPKTLSAVVQQVRQALETAPAQPNLLLIRINYRIRANNALGNLVYPFYIKEGT